MASDLWIWAGIAAMWLARMAVIYAPTMNWLFHSEPLGQDDWLLTLAGSVAIYGMVGLEKLMRRTLSRRRAQK